jgi:malonate-semialdehyde dehydrogenase (acetylating)/methylmalonate-semialdehyde dehydrogenase
MRTIEHWIGGKHVSQPGGRLADVFDPARGATQAQVHLASADEVDAAVQAARDAFESWG